VVTFAVASSFLATATPGGWLHDGFLALLELPALLVGSSWPAADRARCSWSTLLHEVLAGKSIVLLAGAC
jgi:hypothetical protein